MFPRHINVHGKTSERQDFAGRHSTDSVFGDYVFIRHVSVLIDYRKFPVTSQLAGALRDPVAGLLPQLPQPGLKAATFNCQWWVKRL